MYWFWLCNLKEVWNGTIKTLLQLFGTPEAIYEASEKELCIKIGKQNIVDTIIESRSPEKIQSLWEKLAQKKIRFLHIEQQEFPEKLRAIKGCPYGIYVRGALPDAGRKAVAVVGARNSTLYGRKLAHDISFELAANGVDIISGMARGIDSEGHWGAIEAGGQTYAVMGCGADICYPLENIELYERIQENGGILSDYPIGTQPVGWQFPMRNRIISALADRILVVEAREKSGALITVEYGLEQGKDIFAVPGRLEDALSKGCNRLIQEGAGLVTSADDILNELGMERVYNSKKTKNKNIILEKDLETLYSCLSFLPKSIQMLMNETGKNSVEILRDLVKLQMMGLIEEPSKNYYSKKT